MRVLCVSGPFPGRPAGTARPDRPPRRLTPRGTVTILYPDFTAPSRTRRDSLTPEALEVLRVIADPVRPVYLTLPHTRHNRRRFCYWQPYDTATATGNHYSSLPLAVCEELVDRGLVELGPAANDPSKATRSVSLTPAGRACLSRRAVAA